METNRALLSSPTIGYIDLTPLDLLLDSDISLDGSSAESIFKNTDCYNRNEAEDTEPEGQEWQDWDVLLGREYSVRAAPGNQRYRDLILQYRPLYKKASRRKEKSAISVTIYRTITSNGGRFLAKTISDDASRCGDEEWYEISREKALAKIGQAMRVGVASAPPRTRTILSTPRPLVPIICPSPSTWTTKSLQDWQATLLCSNNGAPAHVGKQRKDCQLESDERRNSIGPISPGPGIEEAPSTPRATAATTTTNPSAVTPDASQYLLGQQRRLSEQVKDAAFLDCLLPPL